MPATLVPLVLALAAQGAVPANESRTFHSKGLPRTHGIAIRIDLPPAWRRVEPADELAIAELRGPQGRLTGTLQIARGQRRADMATACRPERARTMLERLSKQEPDARMTSAIAREHEGRPAFELRYEHNSAQVFTRVRSLIVCLKDSQLLVSCAGESALRPALEEIEPVCARVLDSLRVQEQ